MHYRCLARKLSFLVFAIASSLPLATALAQVSNTSKAVSTPVDRRLPSDLRVTGMEYKGFVYKPSIEVEAGFNTNILTEKDNKKSDYIISMRPQLEIEKKYDAHIFSLKARGDIRRYMTRTDENREDFYIGGGALIEANSRWSFPFSIERLREQRPRSSPTPTGLTRKPLSVDRFKTKAGATRSFNRFSLSFEAEYEDVDFQNGPLEDSNDIAVFKDNNREAVNGRLILSYNVPRGTEEDEVEHKLFAEMVYGFQDYDNRAFSDGIYSGPSGDRDIAGLITGFETKYKGLLFARLGAGFIHQNFDDAALDSTLDFDFLADIEYLIAPKLSLFLVGERNIDQDNGFISGITRSRFQTGANAELLHNFYLTAEAEYEHFDFKNVDRKDEDYTGRLRLRYLNSRNITSEFDVGYTQRESSITSNEFDQLIFLLRLRGQL